MAKNSTKKKGSIARKVNIRLLIGTIFVNMLALIVIGSYMQRVMFNQEDDYLKQVVASVSTEIDITLQDYMAINDVISLNSSVMNLMKLSDKAAPMHSHPESVEVLNDLSRIAQLFSGSVINVALLDVEQDGYLVHSGGYSDSSFSFQQRPYYDAVTTKSNMITSPYQDVETGSMVLSIASPVLSDGQALGVVLMDLSIEFVMDLVTSSSFRSTGESFVVDENNLVLACDSVSYVGQDFSTLQVTGTEISQELSNPTGETVRFAMAGENKIGITQKIGDFGWVIVTYMSFQEYQSYTAEVASVLCVMLILSTVFVVGIVAFSIRTSLKPINYIEEAVSQLADGNTHYEIEYESNDEIGRLAEHLRETMENMAQYIDEIQRLLLQCGRGDFVVVSNVHFKGDFASIKHSIEEFAALISTTLDGLKATVEQVSIGSDYVATGSQNLAEGSSRQSSSVQELNNYITDITGHIGENAKNVQEVNQSAQEATEELGRSNEKMSNMVQSMEGIAKTNAGIENIVKTIEDVAFQTNILALNAAIEAARAGSHGRGFAVVADEVRKLSMRTSEAVQETVTLIENTSAAVGQGSRLAKETADSLKTVTKDINLFIGTLEQINKASQDQASDIEHINHGVSAINRVMQENSAISQESAATSEELSTQAAAMRETIEQFKTKEDKPSELRGFQGFDTQD